VAKILAARKRWTKGKKNSRQAKLQGGNNELQAKGPRKSVEKFSQAMTKWFVGGNLHVTEFDQVDIRNCAKKKENGGSKASLASENKPDYGQTVFATGVGRS